MKTERSLQLVADIYGVRKGFALVVFSPLECVYNVERGDTVKALHEMADKLDVT